MEETIIVIMVKNKDTGYLEKELASYKIEDGFDKYIYNTYALEENQKFTVYINLSCEKDLSDWEYEAVFDYYDTETFLPFVTSIEENTDFYNPAWRISIEFENSTEEMEKKINYLLNLHKHELDSVYEAIADKRDEYVNNEEE